MIPELSITLEADLKRKMADPPPKKVSLQKEQKEAGLKRKAQLKALRKHLNTDLPDIFDYRYPQPLEIGIHNELYARYPNYSKKLIRLFLKTWTNNTKYLQRIIYSENRVNLSNQPISNITKAQKDHTKNLLHSTQKYFLPEHNINFLEPLAMRTAMELDLSDIIELDKICYPEYSRETEKWYLNRIKQFHNGCFVLYDNNILIGHLITELWDESSIKEAEKNFSLHHYLNDYHFIGGHILLIDSIVIHPDYQGGGIANQLLYFGISFIVKHHPYVKSSVLVVDNLNPAYRWYERLGYNSIWCKDGFFDQKNKQATFMQHDDISTLLSNLKQKIKMDIPEAPV